MKYIRMNAGIAALGFCALLAGCVTVTRVSYGPRPAGAPGQATSTNEADLRIAEDQNSSATLATGTAEARYGLKFEPVEFAPPRVNHAELANGISLDHYPEPAMPLVTVLVRLRVGSINDPLDKVGAAAMAGQVIRTGGSKKLPGDQLDRELESRGADLSVSTDREETWFRLSVLREDLSWGLDVLTDLLTNPALPANKLEEARGPKLVELQQRFDVPNKVAGALFPQVAYGQGNPWGWTETERTIKALTIEDLRAVYDAHYKTGNMKIGISGGIEFDAARELATSSFGRLPRGEYSMPALPAAEAVAQSRVYVVPRETSQNVIYFGHEGINRFDDDKFAVRVFNNVLAGGFTSRLFNTVRTERGLAYAVFGRVGEGTARGLYYNAAMTKVASTGEALALMFEINRKLQAEPPTASELDVAIQSDANAFVFFFDTAEKIVRQKMTLDGFGYPADYLPTYVASLKAVNGDAVRQAAASRIHLDKVVVLVVGKVDEALRGELEAIGPITEITEEQLRAKWL